ncbi:uncharacterized protein A4U43_C07F31630 [Asparagus officinalis]|uniref:At4g15545-like C-terminal domain-containing protein n=1 Tax=Asparagus officinalis TaxID=4686 RepID=A0A5P1EGA8_ASPOF|nr:uncharacterized protein At4g15545-like [Asparagus officinalis]XP_020274287.1 uncharacterized protein At4g15545-like [Asparagus officinalis]ONK64935.1 uncharacterized protein A4U43_C07F31630 [Asparagus officinalis]
MNQSTDFHLPDEILSVIPTDPYDQLDLARKITSLAIASRVSKLESETGRLRQKVAEKDRTIEELQTKLSKLEGLFEEADSRLRITVGENVKLSKERDSLAITTKKLARDLAKLETFKRHLMQSLSEDNSSQAETVDIRTCDQTVAKPPIWKERGSVSYTSSNLTGGFAESADTVQDGQKSGGQKITPYISPRFTPTGGSPKRYSTAGSPNMTSGATSPTKPRLEGYTSMSPWYPSSQQSSAANSPPRGRSLPGRTPRIDGKEFFRQARSRLSYEQFGAFLANIKELNAHRQSREETLRKAEDIFGMDNKDLFLSFQGLLNRNLP